MGSCDVVIGDGMAVSAISRTCIMMCDDVVDYIWR